MLASPLTSYMTLGKAFKFSGPQFKICKMGGNYLPSLDFFPLKSSKCAIKVVASFTYLGYWAPLYRVLHNFGPSKNNNTWLYTFCLNRLDVWLFEIKLGTKSMFYVVQGKNILWNKELWHLLSTSHLCQIWDIGVDCSFIYTMLDNTFSPPQFPLL